MADRLYSQVGVGHPNLNLAMHRPHVPSSQSNCGSREGLERALADIGLRGLSQLGGQLLHHRVDLLVLTRLRDGVEGVKTSEQGGWGLRSWAGASRKGHLPYAAVRARGREKKEGGGCRAGCGLGSHGRVQSCWWRDARRNTSPQERVRRGLAPRLSQLAHERLHLQRGVLALLVLLLPQRPDCRRRQHAGGWREQASCETAAVNGARTDGGVSPRGTPCTAARPAPDRRSAQQETPFSAVGPDCGPIHEHGLPGISHPE
eukprot:scaffold35739_cov112-Isochrysis_galbana.AAC.4